MPRKRLFCQENDTRSGRRFACRLYPSHGPLRFITSHSFRARLCHAKNEAPEEEAAVLECQNYLKLTDSRRNSLTLWTLCDNELVPNWYRFTNDAGTTMRTSCPAMDACGTVKPGWLDGDHPSASDGRVTRKVCFKDVVGVQPNCCHSSAFIKVRNCSSYIVYYLNGTGTTCPAAYCGSN